MAWGQLSLDKPHLVYILLGAFTSLFMLCSTIIKEKLYIGEATVATVFGVIFGPHATNLINPGTWGNVDKITLEFSRIVLVVQCFAVGVELPRAYMERHWRSVVFLLIPVMTFGWLITSVFIWGCMSHKLNWLDSLVVAACVTATDPVLASSVVGKGKFAKRVPKHLRDLLSAESGCNDGMAFPFIYLGIYLVRYRPDAGTVTWHWIGLTILYECIFGAIYGVVVGYIARRAIRFAHEHDLIDRESFLVFYFVLALFCAGSGAILGIDDLLVGFACGVGFSNDGWFLEKTEESHVSNVIDLLINLAFFVYFGTIIPWEQYDSAVLGISPWRLVVIALLVLFFRRIPIMMALKPVIPDIKTWREALFAGHFGPIGVGAIFVAILARAELETDTTTPLAELPEAGFEHLNIIEIIWPITTFLVIASILVHGSSIAVFTLGKHINTLTITMSYTQATEESKWMDRLPRIASRSKTMSMKKADQSEESLNDKLPDSPAAALAFPRNFLRRQKEEDDPSYPAAANLKRRKYDNGPIEESAISPRPRGGESPSSEEERSGSDTLAVKSDKTPDSSHEEGKKPKTREVEEPQEEVYQEGNDIIIEDEEGNVLEVMESRRGESDAEREHRVRDEVINLMSDEDIEGGIAQKEQGRQKAFGSGKGRESLDAESRPSTDGGNGKTNTAMGDFLEGKTGGKTMQKLMGTWGGLKRTEGEENPPPAAAPPTSEPPPKRRTGPARAFRFGRTIIVEDEDGEVIKTYEIPAPERKKLERNASFVDTDKTRERLRRMSTWLGITGTEDAEASEAGPSSAAAGSAALRKKSMAVAEEEDDDNRIRFTMDGQSQRMNKEDFIKQIQALDPRSRAQVVEGSDAPERVKEEARADVQEHDQLKRQTSKTTGRLVGGEGAAVQRVATNEDRPAGPEGLTLVDSHDRDIPFHSFSSELRGGETAAARRRREAAAASSRQQNTQSNTTAADDLRAQRTRSRSSPTRRSKLDDPESETPAERRRREGALGIVTEDATKPRSNPKEKQKESTAEPETEAERRRREAALGFSKEESDSESEDDLGPMDVPHGSRGVAMREEMARQAETAERRNVQQQEREQAQAQEQETPRPGIRFADQGPRGGGAGGGGDAGESGASGQQSKPSSSRRLRWGRAPK